MPRLFSIGKTEIGVDNASDLGNFLTYAAITIGWIIILIVSVGQMSNANTQIQLLSPITNGTIQAYPQIENNAALPSNPVPVGIFEKFEVVTQIMNLMLDTMLLFFIVALFSLYLGINNGIKAYSLLYFETKGKPDANATTPTAKPDTSET